MAIYLNPGKEAFARALRSEIYVDKSGLIMYTNQVLGTEQRNLCISRPRRFGKSMTARMLAAYYDKNCDSRDLFDGLAISKHASYSKYRNQFDVLFLNMQDFLSRAGKAEELVPFLQKEVLRELREIYRIPEEETDLVSALGKIYTSNNEGFIFIIDEWDCIFREKKNNTESQTMYLDFLRSLLKDKDYVKLAYMTGILPIKKYGTHSALNIFSEFSMTNPKRLAEYVGFTEAEVKNLCEEYQMDFQTAQDWYDGYQFRKTTHIYNPKSVVDAMLNEEFDSYWSQTETYEALKDYINLNYGGLKDDIISMLGGGRCPVNSRRFQNDMTTFKTKDDVLTLLIHLGYLAYDIETKEVFIPNREVEQEFTNAMEGDTWDHVIKAISDSKELLKATLCMNGEAVARGIDLVHSRETSILNYNNENSLSCVISLAYYYAKNDYAMIRELPTGNGFADVVFLPHHRSSERPAIVVELKWNKSASGAIEQIKEKKYMQTLESYRGSILLVAINYDKKSKTHQCNIERYEYH